jgi:hypothetical protein
MSRLLIILLLAAACSNAPVPTAQDEPAAAAVPFETLVQASNPGQAGPSRREVIRDEANWRAAWKELREGSALPEEPPAVDFNREMVILAALETQGCVSRITIRSVTRTADALVVDLLEAPPAPNCVCITSERPIHLVRLPRIDLPARFEAERGRTDC